MFSKRIHLTDKLLVLLLLITSNCLLFVSVFSQTTAQRIWFFDEPHLLFLFIIVNIILWILSLRLSSKKSIQTSHVIFITLIFGLSLELSKNFRYKFLLNPFDTTGLRGFIQDALTLGRIPLQGFYVEYAGQYNKLPLGPLSTIILYLIVGLENNLDTIMKLHEVAIKIILYLLTIALSLKITKMKSIPISLSLLIMMTFSSTTLTLQFYAWPFLILLLYLLFTLSITPRSSLKSDATLYILTNVTLFNTHSVTSLIYFGFSFFAYFILTLKPKKGEENRDTYHFCFYYP